MNRGEGAFGKLAGAVSTKSAGAGGNSNDLKLGVHSLFFSDFLPAAMALQRGQGCLPSKVRVTAWAMESRLKLPASMVVHASDWKTIQCSPMEQASAETRT